LPAVQYRPRDILRGEEVRPPIEFERTTVIDPVLVHGADQVVLNCGPAFPQELEHRGIDRHAVVLHRHGRGHVAATQQRARQIDTRQHGRQEAGERRGVALAVVKDRGLLVGRPWTARQDPRPQLVFFLGADRIQPEERQSADQAGAGGCLQAVRTITKFNK